MYNKNWLERRFLVKTFEEDVKEVDLENSIREIHRLLDEGAS